MTKHLKFSLFLGLGLLVPCVACSQSTAVTMNGKVFQRPDAPLIGVRIEGTSPGQGLMIGADGTVVGGTPPVGPITDAALATSSALLKSPDGVPQTIDMLNFSSETGLKTNCLLAATPDYTGQVQQYKNCNLDLLNSVEPGWNNYGQDGRLRWHVTTNRFVTGTSLSAGIDSWLTVTGSKYAGGDANWVNAYCDSANLWANAGDEGHTCGRLQSTEARKRASGSILIGGTNLTTFVTNCDANCSTLGVQHALLNTTPAKVITVSGATYVSSQNYGGNAGATLVSFPDAHFPVSSCGLLTEPVTTPQTRINEKSVPMPVTVSGLSAGFAVGDIVTFNGPGFRESAVVASITNPFSNGVESFTAALSYPHDKAGRVCTGGLTGYFGEQKQYTTATGGAPYMVFILESPTPTTLLVAIPHQGSLGGIRIAPLVAGLADSGVWRLYQGTTVTDAHNALNAQPGRLTFSGDVNRFTWAPGDTWANYASAAAFYVGLSDVMDISNPYAHIAAHQVITTSATLEGVRSFQAVNQADASLYNQQGGPYQPGPVVVGEQGVYSAGLLMQFYPQGGTFLGNGHPACAVCWFGQGFPLGYKGGQRFDFFGDYALGGGQLGYTVNTRTLDWNGPVQFSKLGAALAPTAPGMAQLDAQGNLTSSGSAKPVYGAACVAGTLVNAGDGFVYFCGASSTWAYRLALTPGGW